MTRGMQLLEQPQTAMNELDLVAAIVPLLANSAEQPRDAAALTEALQKIRAAGVEVAAYVDELVAAKFLDESLEARNWSEYAATVGSLHDKVEKLLEPRAAEVSKNHVVTAVVELCKKDGQYIEPASADIKSVVDAVYEAIAQNKGQHAALLIELGHLQAFMGVHEEMNDEEYNQAERGRDHIMKTKQSMFFKSITMLPTGKVAPIAFSCNPSASQRTVCDQCSR